MEQQATMASSKPRVTVKHPALAMVSMLIGAFVGMFSETSLNIALPSLMSNLGVSTATVQWLVTGYMLVIGVVLPLNSLITKWFTTRQVVIFGLADFLVGAIIAALAPSFSILLIGRMIQGIATGLILPLMFTVAMQVFSPAKIGAAMGACAMVIMFAPAIGPTLTGLILAKLSWHWIFWAFVPFLAIALIFALTSLENVGQISKPKIDVISILTSVVGFASVVTAVSFASSRGWGSPLVLGVLLFGIIVLAVYAYRQVHINAPILNLKIFAVPAFRAGALMVMLDFGIILSAMYVLPMYMQKGLLLPVAMTGIIMLPGGVVNALVSAVSGNLFDNFGAKWLTRLGFLIAIIGAVMLLMTGTHTAIAYLITAHIILMIGCPLAMSPAQTHALNALAGPTSGDGSTIMNTMQQIVGAISTALATSLLGIGQAASHLNAQGAFTAGVHVAIYLPLVLAVVALIIALTTRSFKTEK
ncbi:multidrug efflux MFS transporter [Lactobacillus sp. LC28-10]|uniref:Multidrug efflux MFS transporter n=1 Tax=Secundilactobacillus angelensis TaxID=2722706 RepID=A0ABX1KXP5_9LACO|nr:DHA2 family efflux MFS transporter permease subunit [Secundilactobacillus angelensis]MCH5462903.1 DHA2 family efflux MFS transporter permease subunit [Secundilactobacillus angelensis]NLR18719.1 multidrug efflux MFS transporter [Secundilactobacillus angelensis]